MQLSLSTEQALELRALLDETLREMSHEIAATDNAEFRVRLVERRRHLTEVSGVLHDLLRTETGSPVGAGRLLREIARPGD